MSYTDTPTVQSESCNDQIPSWIMLMIGLSIGLTGMYCLVAQPITRQVTSLESRLMEMDSTLQQLTAVSATVGKTNSLLAGLRSQKSELTATETALSSIARFRQGVEQEGRRAREASAVVVGFASLLEDTVALRKSATNAQIVLDEVKTIHATLDESRDSTEAAGAALEELAQFKRQVIEESQDIETAQTVAQRLVELQTHLIQHEDPAASARQGLAELMALSDEVERRGADVQSAREALDGLAMLKEQLVAQGANIEQSQEVAGNLVALHDALTDERLQTESAGENLDALLQMEQKVRDRGEQIADAMETFELLTSLGEELRAQVASMDRIRRSLIEVTLMEGLVERVARVVEPLVRLGDLRYLSNSEMRAAAQAVLDQRDTRITLNVPEKPTATITVPSSASSADAAIDGSMIDHDTTEGLVPPPKDIE